VTTTLFVCETCRYSAPATGEPCGGEVFAAQVERLAEQHAGPPLQVRRTRCLMACNRHCTVHLRAPGKISYVIGDFEPTAACAATLLDYVGKYQQSDSGQVPYKTWPEGIKGHFIARTPPLDD
jgi:predicted metal-binding protein